MTDKKKQVEGDFYKVHVIDEKVKKDGKVVKQKSHFEVVQAESKEDAITRVLETYKDKDKDKSKDKKTVVYRAFLVDRDYYDKKRRK